MVDHRCRFHSSTMSTGRLNGIPAAWRASSAGANSSKADTVRLRSLSTRPSSSSCLPLQLATELRVLLGGLIVRVDTEHGL